LGKLSITYKQLLERILPISHLPFKDRVQIHNALAEAGEEVLRELAIATAEKLEARGLLRKIFEEESPAGRTVRYRNLLTAESFTIRIPRMEEEEELVRKIAPPYPWRDSRTSVKQMKQIIAMDDRIITGDDKLLSGPAEVLRLVTQTTPDILGCDRACFYFARDSGESPAEGPVEDSGERYFMDQAESWVLRDRFMVYVPDLEAYLKRFPSPSPPPYLSMAMAPVGTGESLSGVLQVWSKKKGFFGHDRLALLEVVAHNSGLLLSRYTKLERLVFRDSLTGVYNRPYFHIQLGNEMARAERENTSLALSILDIDDFKSFNEKFGYEGGNAVLNGIAATLSENVRPFDSVARWGGEEFAIVLSSPVAEEDALAICERLRIAVQDSTYSVTALDGSRHQISVTASAGAAIYPTDAQDGKDLWRKAELALKWAKKHGKNKVVFWSSVRGELEGR